jgi:hypothetical protein
MIGLPHHLREFLIMPGHPILERQCAVCGAQFQAGDRMVLVPIVGITPLGARSVPAALVHTKCLPEDVLADVER